METERNIPNESKEEEPKIKHLVLSGGCVWGFAMFGILEQAIESGFLEMAFVESIYATSVGSIIGAMLSLKIEPHILHDYLIKRPWDAVCKTNRHSVLEIYDGRGIIHRGFMEDIFSPLLKLVELDINITLAEFHEYNGIDFHIYSTELNRYELVDISFKTHPEWKLLDALYASSTIPLIFSPIIRDHQCFIDGAFLLNYPITKVPRDNPKEVLGISLGNPPDNIEEHPITTSSNVVDVVTATLFNVIYQNRLFSNDNSLPFPYQIVIKHKTTLEDCMKTLYSREERDKLVNMGKEEGLRLCKKPSAQES